LPGLSSPSCETAIERFASSKDNEIIFAAIVKNQIPKSKNQIIKVKFQNSTPRTFENKL